MSDRCNIQFLIIVFIFLSLHHIAFGWDINQVGIGNADAEIIDIDVTAFGPWASCPWICLRSADQSKMIWVSDPMNPLVEDVSGTPQKILFDGSGNPVLVYYELSTGLRLVQRNDLGEWVQVFDFPHYLSIWMDMENDEFELIESEIVNSDVYEYGRTDYTTLFQRTIDSNTFTILETQTLDELVSSTYCFRSCYSDINTFHMASPGLTFVTNVYSSYYPYSGSNWHETINILQIPYSDFTNTDQENRLDPVMDVHERPGTGWVTHWLQGSGYWTCLDSGSFLLRQRSLDDLIQINSTSAAIIYHSPMLVFQHCLDRLWLMPEIITEMNVVSSKMCSESDAIWIAYSTDEGVFLAQSDEIADSLPDAEQCDVDGVSYDITTTICHPGDNLTLEISICNSSSEDMEDIPLFCLLEVGGLYFYYPTWTEEATWQTIPALRPGITRVNIFEPIIWPESVGNGSVRFIAAITNTEMTQIIGSIDDIEFGWSE